MNRVLLATIMTLSLAATASENNKDLMVDGKLVRITSETKTHGSDRVFHTKDLSNGIYILTTTNSLGGDADGINLPYATALIRNALVARGIKVADKPEDADIAVVFAMGGSATLVNANAQAEHSGLPNSGKVMASVGAIAAGMAQGGIYAAVGYLAGGLIDSDAGAQLSAFIMDKPAVREVGLFTKRPRVVSTEDKYTTNSVDFSYRLEKGKEATDDAILKLSVGQWVEKFVVVDDVSASISPASAVVATETTEQKK